MAHDPGFVTPAQNIAPSKVSERLLNSEASDGKTTVSVGLPKFRLVNHVRVYKFGLESRLRLSCQGRIRHLRASNDSHGSRLLDSLQQGGGNS